MFQTHIAKTRQYKIKILCTWLQNWNLWPPVMKFNTENSRLLQLCQSYKCFYKHLSLPIARCDRKLNSLAVRYQIHKRKVINTKLFILSFTVLVCSRLKQVFSDGKNGLSSEAEKKVIGYNTYTYNFNTLAHRP